MKVDKALDAGDISSEEAESFLERLSGLNITGAGPDQTQRREESATPDVIKPNVSEIPEYETF